MGEGVFLRRVEAVEIEDGVQAGYGEDGEGIEQLLGDRLMPDRRRHRLRGRAVGVLCALRRGFGSRSSRGISSSCFHRDGFPNRVLRHSTQRVPSVPVVMTDRGNSATLETEWFLVRV